MAKGNVGNLLQHFAVLSAAERMVEVGHRRITYVDCFSMAPWEPVASPRSPFPAMMRAVERSDGPDDLVSRAFRAAWSAHGPPLAQDAGAREYPNSAVLLRAAFPMIAWQMRLHDVDNTKRTQLDEWGRSWGDSVSVGGQWDSSPLVRRAALPRDEPALVVLDPYQVVPDARKSEPGDLPLDKLRLLLGEHGLSVSTRHGTSVAPVVLLLFSYSESAPDATDRAVVSLFKSTGWCIDRLVVRALGGRPRTFHQAWWVSSAAAAAGSDLPGRWVAWTEVLGCRVT